MSADLFEPPRPEPPSGDAERFARLRLIRSPGVGPAAFQRLLSRFGSAEAAIDAPAERRAKAAGLRRVVLVDADVPAAEAEAGAALGARLLHLGEPAYPSLLAEIDAPPPCLWALGEPAALARRAIAIVGTRNVSAHGARFAERLAADLTEAGVLVVSGLARGVDAAAHRGALEAGGATAAAVAGGADHVYPPENAGLWERIAAAGVILSEMPIGLQPQAKHFPRRNRIIAGLSLGVVVVEGAERSGSLITARAALEMGREAMAVPGHPLDGRAAGGNRLIREGAPLIRDAADVIDALGEAGARGDERRWRAARLVSGAPEEPPLIDEDDPASASPAPEPGALPERLLALLGPTPTPIDELVRRLGAPAEAVSAALFELELTGAATRAPGDAASLPPAPGGRRPS